MTPWLLALALLTAGANAAEPYNPQTRKGIDAYNEVLGHLDKRQLKPAEAKARKCLKLEPNRGACQTLLAEVWSRGGQLEEAVASLQTVAQAHPGELEPKLMLSFALFSLQRFDEAREWSGRALEGAPADLRALSAHQMVLVRLGQYDEMLALLDAARAAGSKPEHDCLESVVRLQKEHAARARALLVSCRQADDSSFIANAEAAFTAATGEHTTGADALVKLLDEQETPLSLAITAFNAQAFEEAEGLATQAIDDPALTTQARVLRALARFELGREKAALKDLDDALLSGTWIDVHQSGVLTGILTKRAEEFFLDQLRRGAAVRVLLLVGAGRVDDAEAALPAAREAFGDDPELLAAETWVHVGRGDPGKAWASATAALSVEVPPTMADRAVSMLALNHLGAASPEQKAVAAERGSISTRFNLAAGMSNLGDVTGCLSVLRPLAGTEDSIPQRVGEDRAAANALLPLQPRLNLLAHSCAAGARDLEAAIAFWALLGPPVDAPSGNVINHALLLLQSGRAEAAWTTFSESSVLDRAEGQHLAAALQVAIGAATDTERWDDVLALATHPEAPPTTRLSAGTALGAAGRRADAVRILKATCSELAGETRALCTNNLRAFSQ